MRNRPILLALFAATLAGAATVEAARPAKTDAPTSRPTRDLDKAFKRLDTDHDGLLSKTEFAALAKRVAERREKNGKDAKADAPTGDKLFDKLDADKDGFLSPDEFKKVDDLRGNPDKREGRGRRAKPAT